MLRALMIILKKYKLSVMIENKEKQNQKLENKGLNIVWYLMGLSKSFTYLDIFVTDNKTTLARSASDTSGDHGQASSIELLHHIQTYKKN